MERVATDVARPPIRGGELPSFEELLASGSFHARLARARAERERALAEADGADDFILDTSRKPWEREEGARRRPDRLSVALEAAAVVAPARAAPPRAVPVMPAGRPGAAPEVETDRGLRRTGAEAKPALLPALVPVRRDSPALPPRRLHVLPAVLPVDTEIEETAAPKRRIAMIEGGFALGLAIGFLATVVMPWLIAAVQTSEGPAPAIDAAGPAFVTAAPRPSPPVADASLVLPGPLTVAGPAPAAPLGLSVPAESEPALSLSALPLGPTLPASLADVALASAVASAALPTPLQGFAAVAAGARLASASAADAPPAAVAAPAHPSVGAALDLPAPAAAAEAAPTAPAIAAPGAGLRGKAVPAATLASAVPTDAPPAAQVMPAAPAPGFSGTIVVNAPDSVAEDELARLVGGLATSGFAPGDPHRVGITVKQSNVRYFHPEDAAAAEAVAGTLGARARDFTDFSPAPPPGTIEVWLAGRGDAPAAAAKPRRASGQVAPTAADQQLLQLRNRILQQLRTGDHL